MARVSASIVAIVLLAFASNAPALPVVNVGTVDLQPNKAGQTVSISVIDPSASAVENIQGLKFILQIGAGTGTAPSITSIDVINGNTIFTGNNMGQFTPAGESFPQALAVDTLSNSGFVNDNGTLANITFDTTGVTSGTFPLSIGAGSTRLGSTAFLNGSGDTIPSTLVDGLIVITPEPASLSLLAVGAACLLVRRRRQSV